MGFKKGHKRVGGRPKGGTNKVTAEVKAAIQAAFEEVGGHTYLVGVARKQPHVFCQLLGKIIPTEVKAELTGRSGRPIISKITIEHHVTAPVQPADGGSGRGRVEAPVPPRPNAGVGVNGSLPSRLGGHT